MVKSIIWYILKKKECGEWNNIKRPGNPQKTTCVKHCAASVMTWACMAVSHTSSLLVLIDDVIADRTLKCTDLHSVSIQQNAANTGQMYVDPKHTSKATFQKAKR